MFLSIIFVADPLFIDPYAAVLLSLDVASEDKDLLALHLMPSAEHYRLVTRYIDDKLQHFISNSDDLRQMEWTLVLTG
jgi:O-methyltransferase involved in polyketide biosynthesis